MELTLDQALQQGVEAHKAGQVQEADRLYTAILKVQPKHPHANHNMGVLAVSVGKVQEALPFFKTALEANPSMAKFWLSYIDALIKLDRLPDAKAIFDLAKSNGTKGEAFDRLDQRLDGVKPSNIKVSQNQDPPHDKFQPVINLYSQGQLQEALDTASKLLQKFPNSATLQNICGAATAGLGQLDEAIDAYNKAVSINPDFAEAYNNMGAVLKDQGKLEDAIEAYNKALAIKPDYAEAYSNMGNSLKEQGKLEEAIESYSKALALKPDYAEAYNNIGVIFQQQGKLEEAIEAYNKALAIKLDYADAHNNMGIALKKQGKLEEGIEAYNKALALKPDYAEAYKNMGNALQEKGKLEEAIGAYNKALALKPDYAEAYLGLNNAQKRLVPAWHLEMMNDGCRNKAYLDAIKLAVSKDDFILEIGTGSGLLAMMAAESGSKQIITCESSKTISDVAKKIISENGYDDIIKVINKKSTELMVGEDLPRKADVIISEVISAGFVGEGVQTTILDANKRLLRKNGKMLPESGDIRIALLGEDTEINGNVAVGNVCGFDLSKFNSLLGNKFSLKLKNKPRLLSGTEIAFTIDLLRSERIITKQKVLNLTVQESGTCLGVIQWLGIQIYKDIEYENKPGEIVSHWPTPIYMFESPKELISGDIITIKASLLKDSIWFQYID